MPDTTLPDASSNPSADNAWQQGAPVSATSPTGHPVPPAVPSAAYEVATPVLDEQDAEALGAYRTLEARRKRKRRNRIIVGCVVAALALAGVGWWIAGSLAGEQEVASEGSGYDVGYALLDTYEKSVSASGAIKPASQVVVTPEVDGIITGVVVHEGDHVSKGDLLFSVRNASLDKAVQDAEQALKSANNEVVSCQNALSSANNALANARSNYDRVFSTGYETQEEADAAGMQASDALTVAETGVSNAELALENAQIAVTSAQEALDQAHANASKRSVVAPQSGVVVAMNAVEGASTGSVSQPGSSNSLVTIADLTTLRVSVQVNEVDINNLREGQKAEVSFSALPDVVLSATVERIAAIASGSDNQGGNGIVTYDVDMVIERPDPQVKPGMTARVKILTERIENAMTVPVAALVDSDDTQATIFVASGYTGTGDPDFQERTVAVVAKDATTAVVEGDLSDGDAVQVFYDTADDASALSGGVE